MAKDFEISSYTEYLNNDMLGSNSLLKDFPYVDSIASDQQFSDTSAQKTAFTADGSDANIYSYDFDAPTGLRFWYAGGGGGARLPLSQFIPVGTAGASLAGSYWQHGVEDIGVLVMGSGEGLGSRAALFCSEGTYAGAGPAYFGMLFSDSGNEYLIVAQNVTVDADWVPSGDLTYDLGSPSARWQSIYTGGISSGGTVSADNELLSQQGDSGPTAGGKIAVTISSAVTSGKVFGVYWGSGAPTIGALQGSLYLRTDGSSTTTRAYINTDGDTTWTSIATAA